MMRCTAAALGFACLAPFLACSTDGSSGPGPGDDAATGDGGGSDGPGGGDAADATRDGGGEAGPADPLDPSYEPPVDTNPAHYDPNEWITTAMAKVQPTDPPGTIHWALISAGRNETESFQVHVHAPSALAAVSVSVSDLHDARSGATISAQQNIVVSRELYLHIPAGQVSDANGTPGDVPDALMPAVDPYFHETRKAFPFDVAANTNTSTWVDVTVPPGTPSGWYTATVTVTAGNKTLSTMPVRLELWQVDLPSTATLRSDFGMSWDGACVQQYGGYTGCGQVVGGSDDAGVEYFHQLYTAFALDHRVSIGGAVYAGPSGSDWTHFDSVYSGMLDGTAKTRLAGAKLTTLDYVGQTDPTTLALWESHFKSKGWLDVLVYYHCDEPASGNSCTFAQALAEENTVHMAASDFRTLLTANVADITNNGLLDSVDVITPVVDQMQPHMMPSQRPMYDSFLMRSAQKRLYWYQSCDEHESCDNAGTPGPATATWPSYMADASPMRNRVFQWLAYVFNVQGELYYAADLCFQQPCGGGTTDPLRSIYAFSGNGDGTLFYAGKPEVIGGTHHVPMSSIRFELIREGMEDYELLHALDAGGDAMFAMMQAQTFIQRADTFDPDPNKLYAAREACGMRLHKKAFGGK